MMLTTLKKVCSQKHNEVSDKPCFCYSDQKTLSKQKNKRTLQDKLGALEILSKTLNMLTKKAPFYDENIEIINIVFNCEQRRLCTAAHLVFKEICYILSIKQNIYII